MLAHCVARTGCRHLGLLVGEQGGLHSLGLVGLLVKFSPDVETALRSLVRYLHLHVRGAVTTLAVEGELAELRYDIYQPRVEATDQVGDGAVALMTNIMRALCGPRWKPVELRFAHRRPDDVGPFRRIFRAPLRFDAEHNAVAFSADWLDRPVSGAEPELRRLLQQQIDLLDARHGDDFPEQVRSVLRTALVTGDAGADQVAALFSMHSRTLHRRLAAFGTGFRGLVDEGRYAIARQLLEDTTMEVSRIAALLDYARRQRLHAGVPPLERNHAEPLAGGAGGRSAALTAGHCGAGSPPTCSLTILASTRPRSVSSSALGVDAPEQVQQRSDQAGPSGLVAGAEAGAVVAVEVLVEQDQVAPVRIVLELGRAAVDRPPAVGIAQERARQPADESPAPPRTASSAGPSRSGIPP